MKVLGISGSLRDQSNTLYYVKTALKVLEEEEIETELISLRDKEIKPCTGCYDCQTQGFCTIPGDDFEEVFTRMRLAEGLVLGSPVLPELGGAPDDGPALPGHLRLLLERQIF